MPGGDPHSRPARSPRPFILSARLTPRARVVLGLPRRMHNLAGAGHVWAIEDRGSQLATESQHGSGVTPLSQEAPGAETPEELAPDNQGIPPQAAPQQPAPPPSAAALPHHKIKRTRMSGIWVAVGCFAVILLLLLIFILQNSQKVDISYMGAHGHLPLGVALLLAAVCGVLLVVLAGTARISQLRATARKHRRADARRVKGADGPS